MPKPVKVLVVFYSMYGNVAKLAKAVVEGSKQIEGVDVSLKQASGLIPRKNRSQRETWKSEGGTFKYSHS